MVNLSLHTLHKKKMDHRSESKEESFIAHHFGRVAKEGRSRIYIGTKCKYVKGTFDSIWGSPFSVQRCGREKCIKRYETYVRSNEFLMREIPSLKGKTLECWCKQQKCRGDVSARLADESKQIDGFFFK